MTTRNEREAPAVVLAGPVDIAKNTRGVLRLLIEDFAQRKVVSARLWFQAKDGTDLRPTIKGWSLPIDKLPAIIEALQQLAAEARRLGVLE